VKSEKADQEKTALEYTLKSNTQLSYEIETKYKLMQAALRGACILYSILVGVHCAMTALTIQRCEDEFSLLVVNCHSEVDYG
jgi:hypothetical protein